MDFELVMNELALDPPAQNLQSARQSMLRFLGTILQSVRQGAKRVVRTQRSFPSQVLAPDYPLAKWRNDPAVDLEWRRYFGVLVTKAPYLDGLPELEDTLRLHEFFVDGRRAEGLGVACALETVAISLDLASTWNRPRYQVERQWIEAHDESFHTLNEEVVHASTREHVIEHANWMLTRIRTGVRDGSDLWDRRNEILPNLRFCESAKQQLQKLGPTHVMLTPVKKRLFELNDFSARWLAGPFDHTGLLNASPESEGVKKAHAALLTFTCPDGVDRLFSWHLRLTPDEWRIHFHPDGVSRRVVIGRIGRKPYI